MKNISKNFAGRGWSIGVNRYRKIHVNPWRIIYEVTTDDVYIHWVVDSRRDDASQFEERILRV